MLMMSSLTHEHFLAKRAAETGNKDMDLDVDAIPERIVKKEKKPSKYNTRGELEKMMMESRVGEHALLPG